MATLVNADNSVLDTNNMGLTSNSYHGTEFLIPASSIITGVGLKGTEGASAIPGTFSLNIYEGGTTPNGGTLIKTETFDRNVLPAYTDSPTMFQIDFATPTGTLGGGATVYWVWMQQLTGSSNDNVRWSVAGGNPFADGKRWFSGNGSSWFSQATIDMNFAIYGTEGEGGVANLSARRQHLMMM